MPTVNNIFNIKISSVSSNGSINFGDTVHKDLAVNIKRVGGMDPIGDGCVNISSEGNNVIDPDINDQPSIQV